MITFLLISQLAGSDHSEDSSSHSPFNHGQSAFTFEDETTQRPRSLTFGSGLKDLKTPEDGCERKICFRSESTPVTQNQGSKSSLYNIFFKIGKQKTSSKASDESLDGNLEEASNVTKPPNRKAIFSVIQSTTKHFDKKALKDSSNEGTEGVKKRTKEELIELWRKAINQQIVLIQMEKENQKLQGNSLININ